MVDRIVGKGSPLAIFYKIAVFLSAKKPDRLGTNLQKETSREPIIVEQFRIPGIPEPILAVKTADILSEQKAHDQYFASGKKLGFFIFLEKKTPFFWTQKTGGFFSVQKPQYFASKKMEFF